jgi:hypothetical protein
VTGLDERLEGTFDNDHNVDRLASTESDRD